MQTVHTVLLPSGKVLMASGSSWRNKIPTPFYPSVSDPTSGTGLFNRSDAPFSWSKQASYYSQVNSVGMYDVDANIFFRLPHPLPTEPDPDNAGAFLPTDLFCSGQQHVRDGNVLFTGGTQYYAPYRTGTQTTYIFDWKTETGIDWTAFNWTVMPLPNSTFYPWKFSGNMAQGRWYPSSVPLLDGRLLVTGGFIGFDSAGRSDMYMFEMNQLVEFFDYDAFKSNPAMPQQAWIKVNVSDMDSNPFATRLKHWPPRATECSQERECQAYRNDSFKLYPQNYLLPDGRVYFTREGDFNSLRNANASSIRRTDFTYYLHINGTRTEPQLRFEPGPPRPGNVTSSGTTVLDPNDSTRILLMGGMPLQTAGTMLPALVSADDLVAFQDDNLTTQFAGSRGTRKLEIFSLPKGGSDTNGSWVLSDEAYLGETLVDDRTMHFATILPTKQMLVIAGGNYDFFGAVTMPLLLTPIYLNGKFTGNYTRMRMAPGREPRLYHCTALLLPDGRIWMSGGNAARATLDVDAPESDPRFDVPGEQPKPNVNRVNLGVYFFTDGQIGEGHNSAPAENWVMETYSPPYLFIDGARRTVVEQLQWEQTATPAPTGYTVSEYLAGKQYYLLLSEQTYSITLGDLPTTCALDTISSSLVLVKLGVATHGWDHGQRLYDLPFTVVSGTFVQFRMPVATELPAAPAYYMLFFVDCRGKPTEAVMVRWDDKVTHPLA